MQDVLERLKAKKLEIERKKKGNLLLIKKDNRILIKKDNPILIKKDRTIFVKVENKNNKTIYHTGIMNDFYIFGVNNKRNNKFFISFREFLNQEKIISFNLFSVMKDGDGFLGIFYGCKKPVQKVEKRYEENGQMKVLSFSKVYYIEFRFRKGSVFCYVIGIANLLKKDKINTKYYKSLFERLINLERQVFEFYNKNLPDRSFIERWMEGNSKNYAPPRRNKKTKKVNKCNFIYCFICSFS